MLFIFGSVLSRFVQMLTLWVQHCRKLWQRMRSDHWTMLL